MNTSYRTKILRAVFEFYLEHKIDNFILVDTLPSFTPGNQKYLAAVSQLLSEELLLGLESENQRLSVSINPAKIMEVRSELDVWYRDTRFMISMIIGMAGWVVALIGLIS